MTGNSDVSPNQNFENEYREATTNCNIMRHLQTITEMNMISNETDYSLPVPLPPSATPVEVMASAEDGNYLHNISTVSELTTGVKVKLENLETDDQETLDMDTHMSLHPIKIEVGVSSGMNRDFMNLLPGENGSSFGEDIHHSGDDTNDSTNNAINGESLQKGMYLQSGINGPKTWSQHDMDNALDALRNHNMSLTKASATYGIPSTTLWQRAHRLGIDTPKKEGPSKSWSENNLHNALQALRTGTISANKASKAYGIPSSTLYKIARREGIRLAAPFNAAPTTWRPDDLERALESIRSGLSSVQRASTEFGIPTGTLYGRCKREGIELSRSNPTPWSEDAMNEALDAVRVGQMSINQAAIHYNLPYSSLYGRIKRCKFEIEGTAAASDGAIVPSQSTIGDSMVPALIADPAQHSAHIPHNMHMSHPQHNMIPQELHYPTMEPLLDAQGTQDDYSRRFYSVYHHSLTVPSDDHTDASHLTTSNHDCISTS